MGKLALKISPRRENDRGRGERLNIGQMLAWILALVFLAFAVVGFSTGQEIGVGVIGALIAGLFSLGFGILSRKEKTRLFCHHCGGRVTSRTLICPHCGRTV